MTPIDDVLQEINGLAGVRGSALATLDGMTVAGALGGHYREDVVSGLASFLIHTTRRAIDDPRVGIDRFVIHATHGKLLLFDVGEAFLVVITDQFAALEGLIEHIEGMVRRLGALTHMG